MNTKTFLGNAVLQNFTLAIFRMERGRVWDKSEKPSAAQEDPGVDKKIEALTGSLKLDSAQQAKIDNLTRRDGLDQKVQKNLKLEILERILVELKMRNISEASDPRRNDVITSTMRQAEGGIDALLQTVSKETKEETKKLEYKILDDAKKYRAYLEQDAWLGMKATDSSKMKTLAADLSINTKDLYDYVLNDGKLKNEEINTLIRNEGVRSRVANRDSLTVARIESLVTLVKAYAKEKIAPSLNDLPTRKDFKALVLPNGDADKSDNPYILPRVAGVDTEMDIMRNVKIAPNGDITSASIYDFQSQKYQEVTGIKGATVTKEETGFDWNGKRVSISFLGRGKTRIPTATVGEANSIIEKKDAGKAYSFRDLGISDSTAKVALEKNDEKALKNAGYDAREVLQYILQNNDGNLYSIGRGQKGFFSKETVQVADIKDLPALMKALEKASFEVKDKKNKTKRDLDTAKIEGNSSLGVLLNADADLVTGGVARKGRDNFDDALDSAPVRRKKTEQVGELNAGVDEQSWRLLAQEKGDQFAADRMREVLQAGLAMSTLIEASADKKAKANAVASELANSLDQLNSAGSINDVIGVAKNGSSFDRSKINALREAYATGRQMMEESVGNFSMFLRGKGVEYSERARENAETAALVAELQSAYRIQTGNELSAQDVAKARDVFNAVGFLRITNTITSLFRRNQLISQTQKTTPGAGGFAMGYTIPISEHLAIDIGGGIGKTGNSRVEAAVNVGPRFIFNVNGTRLESSVGTGGASFTAAREVGGTELIGTAFYGWNGIIGFNAKAVWGNTNKKWAKNLEYLDNGLGMPALRANLSKLMEASSTNGKLDTVKFNDGLVALMNAPDASWSKNLKQLVTTIKERIIGPQLPQGTDWANLTSEQKSSVATMFLHTLEGLHQNMQRRSAELTEDKFRMSFSGVEGGLAALHGLLLPFAGPVFTIGTERTAVTAGSRREDADRVSGFLDSEVSGAGKSAKARSTQQEVFGRGKAQENLTYAPSKDGLRTVGEASGEIAEDAGKKVADVKINDPLARQDLLGSLKSADIDAKYDSQSRLLSFAFNHHQNNERIEIRTDDATQVLFQDGKVMVGGSERPQLLTATKIINGEGRNTYGKTVLTIVTDQTKVLSPDLKTMVLEAQRMPGKRGSAARYEVTKTQGASDLRVESYKEYIKPDAEKFRGWLDGINDGSKAINAIASAGKKIENLPKDGEVAKIIDKAVADLKIEEAGNMRNSTKPKIKGKESKSIKGRKERVDQIQAAYRAAPWEKSPARDALIAELMAKIPDADKTKVNFDNPQHYSYALSEVVNAYFHDKNDDNEISKEIKADAPKKFQAWIAEKGSDAEKASLDDKFFAGLFDQVWATNITEGVEPASGDGMVWSIYTNHNRLTGRKDTGGVFGLLPTESHENNGFYNLIEENKIKTDEKGPVTKAKVDALKNFLWRQMNEVKGADGKPVTTEQLKKANEITDLGTLDRIIRSPIALKLKTFVPFLYDKAETDQVIAALNGKVTESTAGAVKKFIADLVVPFLADGVKEIELPARTIPGLPAKDGGLTSPKGKITMESGTSLYAGLYQDCLNGSVGVTPPTFNLRIDYNQTYEIPTESSAAAAWGALSSKILGYDFADKRISFAGGILNCPEHVTARASAGFGTPVPKKV